MHRGRQSKFKHGHGKPLQPLSKEPVDTTVTSEIVDQLRICASELEEKQDRHERIVKISRDITIDSKRGTPDADDILTEARTKLIKIVKSYFCNIAKELNDLDIFQFTRAYTFGVQEFIEALSFYHYLVHDTLLTFNHVKEFLREFIDAPVDTENEHTSNMEFEKRVTSDQCYFVTMFDYVLGLSDLTGELMRYSINQVAAGRREIAFDTCRFLTNLYTGMLSIDCHSREFNRKMYTFIQNVKKVEMACYTVKVRGSEMPKHMIFDVLNQDDESDEVHF